MFFFFFFFCFFFLFYFIFFNEHAGYYRRLLICLLEARLMLGFMSLLRSMNPGVCSMSLFADYVKLWIRSKVKGVTLTIVTHVASFSHLAD